MSEPTDGGQAFPTSMSPRGDFNTVTFEHGMSLRDWFAVQALNVIHADHARFVFDGEKSRRLTEAETIAIKAYQVADAMLTERAKHGA